MAEVTSAIVCGCLPVLPQLFRHYLPIIGKSLSATFRSMRQSRSSDLQRSKDSRDDTWNPALSKGNYVELNEHSQSMDGKGIIEKDRKQDPRSETKITANRNPFKGNGPAVGNKIYTESKVTVV